MRTRPGDPVTLRRAGLSVEQERRVRALAARYHPGYDWPGAQAPGPREHNRRRCWHRWLSRRARIERMADMTLVEVLLVVIVVLLVLSIAGTRWP